jgi:ribosomal protein S8
MNISGQGALMKNQGYLNSIDLLHKRRRRRKRGALNPYTVKNQDVLSILYRKKTKALHLRWTKNVSKPENKKLHAYKLYYNLIALEL